MSHMLSTLKETETLNRYQFYEWLTGQKDIPFGVGTKGVHPYLHQITTQNLHSIQRAAQLLKTSYGGNDYYTGPAETLEDACKSGNLEEVRYAMSDLLIAIIYD